MSFEYETFNKENLEKYLAELAKRYKKLSGRKMHAELILIGGASVLTNYGFRDSTTDIDAIITAASCMKDAIRYVAEQYNLPDKWLNADFKKTGSYSSKLYLHSEYYKTFANNMDVRTVKGEYLVAMKLVAGRTYKNDLTDIIGIIIDENKNGNSISKQEIIAAVEELYGSWDKVGEDAKVFLDDVLNNPNLEQLFAHIKEIEKQTKTAIIESRELISNNTSQA